MTDMELYSYAYYITTKGADLRELLAMTPLEKSFHTASMLVIKSEIAKDNVALAEYTGAIANPFIKVGDKNG